MTADIRNSRAVLVGIDRYQFLPDHSLKGPSLDACRMGQLLLQYGMPPRNIAVLVARAGEEPGKRIEEGLYVHHVRGGYEIYEYLEETLRSLSGDCLLLYWSGHGFEYLGNLWVCLPEARHGALRAMNLTGDILPKLRGAEYCFPEQRILVDACRRAVTDWVPPPQGWPLSASGSPCHSLQALLATESGQEAVNLPDEATGLFSKVVIEELNSAGGMTWPWDLLTLRDRLNTPPDSSPINLEYRAGNGIVRSGPATRTDPSDDEERNRRARAAVKMVRDSLRALQLEHPEDLPRSVWKSAFFEMEQEVLTTGTEPRNAAPMDYLNALLMEDPTLRDAGFALEFLERVAAELARDGREHIANKFQDRCDGIVLKYGELRKPLAEIRGRIAERPLDSFRHHLLIRILPVQDSDREQPDGLRYNVTSWRYVADRYSPVPVSYDRYSTGRRHRVVAPEEMEQYVAGLVEENDANGRLIIEFMRDNDELNEPVEQWRDANNVTLGKQFGVVVRPAQTGSGNPATWFRNWEQMFGQRLSVQFNLVQGRVFRARPITLEPHVAIAIRCDDDPPIHPREFVAPVVDAGIPVAVWRRGGGELIHLDEQVGYKTPSYYQTCRIKRPESDVVLMWHNPHWVPVEDVLEWRPGES